MKIAIIGLGHVGLVTACCLVNWGHQVYGFDQDEKKVKQIKEGVPPFYEPALDQLLQDTLASEHFLVHSTLTEAISQCELILLAVGTPISTEGKLDLNQLWQALEDLVSLPILPPYLLIKSTVPPGTTTQIYHRLQDRVEDVICHPEFLRQGNAIEDFQHPNRLIFGLHHEDSQAVIQQLYHPFQKKSHLFQYCTPASAELIKLGANAFLATKISFINQMANFAEQVGANIEEISIGLGSDPRIGPQFLQAGLGYGGPCLPKDLTALSTLAESPLLASTTQINEQQPHFLLQRIESELGDLKGCPIALLGLTFKPNTNDLQASQAMYLAELLLQRGAIVQAYDPVIKDTPCKQLQLAQTIEDAIKGSKAVIIATDWEDFQQLDWSLLQRFRISNLFDGRNLFPYKRAQKLARIFRITYHSVGRPTIRVE
ncbi:UDPglucose 6-dehydrogenase [Seinonella peptonophila]|uniref:UDP-glucose 6-dehydrogenase n=1 Tax=Seinonella peptonophila TaxID=112248 RepID=A0A1M5AHA6_9BACL|nr:UDP-glucose/GDP-mannose dehydrogenase family protein [Seinonella peptonophila]SHF29669.1 UDPglucose 6-dehydrogenase [Seinonella peptonophila]